MQKKTTKPYILFGTLNLFGAAFNSCDLLLNPTLNQAEQLHTQGTSRDKPRSVQEPKP